jgi:hypothetical protein
VCDGRTGECNLQTAYAWELEAGDAIGAKGNHQTFQRPHSLATVLMYAVGQSKQVHAKSNEKVWGFGDLIDRALRSPYLLVTRHISRDTPKGKETVGYEGLLLDLDRNAVVGAFPYPARLTNAEHAQERERFLAETLGGRYAPGVSPRHDPRRSDIEWVTFLVVAWTSLLGIVFIASIPTAIVFRKQQHQVEDIKERGVYPDELCCPMCMEMTDSLKHYAMLRYAVFLVIAGVWERETVTACPHCMRRHIRKRFWINLIPANLLMLGCGPIYLVQWLRTVRRGHSPSAIEPTV